MGKCMVKQYDESILKIIDENEIKLENYRKELE